MYGSVKFQTGHSKQTGTLQLSSIEENANTWSPEWKYVEDLRFANTLREHHGNAHE